ncbi:MAG: hypothetical protein D6731_24985 [Planctomycetota bacterium]|nr:MAG: hypothetical protein D6731_24985 [Planctomycetota bacterium]
MSDAQEEDPQSAQALQPASALGSLRWTPAPAERGEGAGGRDEHQGHQPDVEGDSSVGVKPALRERGPRVVEDEPHLLPAVEQVEDAVVPGRVGHEQRGEQEARRRGRRFAREPQPTAGTAVLAEEDRPQGRHREDEVRERRVGRPRGEEGARVGDAGHGVGRHGEEPRREPHRQRVQDGHREHRVVPRQPVPEQVEGNVQGAVPHGGEDLRQRDIALGHEGRSAVPQPFVRVVPALGILEGQAHAHRQGDDQRQQHQGIANAEGRPWRGHAPHPTGSVAPCLRPRDTPQRRAAYAAFEVPARREEVRPV